MRITLNERSINTAPDSTLHSLRAAHKPDADVIILNGHLMRDDAPLSEGDSVALITRGEVPTGAELEALMAARHTPGVHEKLKRGRVAIAGLGGLGSNIAVSLARMGVGHLLLVDFDVVEPSNLNRQHYFIDQIGMSKCDALKNTLMRVNPYLDYVTRNEYVTETAIPTLFSGYDVIIEAFDRAEVKALFFRTCLLTFPAVPVIGASGVAGVHDTALLATKRIGKNGYMIGDFHHEARPGEGLMATRVTVAANMQANLAVQLLLSKENEV